MKLYPLLTGIIMISGVAQLNANNPCEKIKAACEAAGYKQGGHTKDVKKGLQADCIKPLLEGIAVVDVKVDAADVTACKEQKAKHKAKQK